MVESMEQNFKKDVLRELKAGNGRILLHDEVEERPGVFSIIPIWENVSKEDIMTPRDVFDLMTHEGFKIDYGRIAIVCSSTPGEEFRADSCMCRLMSRHRYPRRSPCFSSACGLGCPRPATLSSIAKWDVDERRRAWSRRA